MKKTILAGAALFAAFSASAEKLAFLGTTDKNPLEYALNETITFTVTLVDKDNGNAAVTGRELKWTLFGDDSSLDCSGTATSDTPLVVTTSLSTPGFVRLKVQVKDNNTWLDGNDNKFDGGAGADVMNIEEWPAPADFAAFWCQATNTLYSTAYVPVCTNFNPEGAVSGVSYYLFDIPVSAGERNATGILAKPTGVAAGSCGIIVHTYGYGYGRTELPKSTEVLAGNIVVNVARHGEDPWNPDDAYYTNDVQKGFAKSFCFRNNDGAVADTDYYKMIMRDLRAAQYAKSLPEWNGAKLETTGGSMGGWQALAIAALDCDVTKCSAAIPWSADLAGYTKYGYMKGWRPDWTANLDYIDLKNLATLVRCPVTISAGLGDYVCPPSGEIQLYRALSVEKQITFTQNMGHGALYGPSAPKYTLQASAPEAEPEPRTLNWIGGNNKKWNNIDNWQDADGLTNALPRNGDTIYLNGVTGTENDIVDFMPYMVKLKGYQTHKTTSKPVIFRNGSYGIYNEGYLFFDVPIQLEGTNINFYSSSLIGHRGPLSSWDGADCGIVKTGTGRAGIQGANCTSSSDFAGFKYVTIKEGQWIFGVNSSGKMHLLPPGMTVTFDGASTSLGISCPCVLTNFCIRETAAAYNMAHAITCQIDSGVPRRGKLTLRGTPPDDSTVFTGSFESTVDFRWEPDSSTKEFVLSGRNSTTTGDVEVANGTLRLTAGASYSKLGKLTVGGGTSARLVVDAAPATAFHAEQLSLLSANERLVLSEGVTLTFGSARVNRRAVASGTYSGVASEDCTQVDWITGAGKVVVEDGVSLGDRLVWQGSYNGNWSVAENWKNETSGETSAVPLDGDTLVFPSAKVDGQTLAANNDLVELKPYRIELPTSYSGPKGNALVFDEHSWGIYNKGYMYYNLDTIVTAPSINIYCSDLAGHNKGIHSPDGSTFRIVKTGTGWLGFLPSAGSSFAGLKYFDLQEGKIVFGCQHNGDMSLFPAGMEVTFSGENTSLQFSKDCTFADFYICEDASVVGKPHTIGSMERLANGESYIGSITITGTPPVDSMPFTGTIVNPVSFCWNPDSAAKEFVLKGSASISSTTGRIEVAHGTIRFDEGASFTNLTWITLSGGAESCLAFDAAPAYGPQAKILTLATGSEKLKLGGGVVFTVDSATIGGDEVPAGCYCSQSNVGGTRVDWITGGGYVCVGGASLPSHASGAGVAGTWTANGGSDTSIGNAANWGEPGNTVLPDLTGGTLDATFGAGVGAALDRVANFHGLAFAPPGEFSLTSQNTDYFAALGEGGLSTSGDGRAVTLGWPLFLAADQTWNVAAGDTLNVAGPIGGSGALVVKGGGTLNLNAATEMGSDVYITNAIVNVNADNAFGSCGDPVKIDLTASKLTLNGVTLGRGFTDMASGTSSSITIAANTDNVIEGDISFPNAPTINWTFGENSSLRVKGSIKRYNTNWCYFKDNGTLYLDGPLMMSGPSAYAMGANKTIYFNAPTNNFGSFYFWVMGSNGRIYTTVPYAITKDSHVRASGTPLNCVWDLCGCDQGIKSLGFPKGVFTVTSDEPATLHLKGTAYVDSEITNLVAFTGAANLSFEGTSTGYHMYNAASTSTGTVEVASGTFALGPNGTWTNATKVVVTGGTLKLENKGTFGKGTDMELAASGAAVALNYDGVMRMNMLYVDGEKQTAGVYGAVGNSAVPAGNQLPCFTGTGCIRFGLGGTLVIVR